MTRHSFFWVLVTLLIGFSGAVSATAAGLPAASLVGASIAVAIASFLGVTREIPTILRNVAFTTIGCSLGSGITKDALAHAAAWPVSLVTLGVAVCVIILVGSWFLSRFYAFSPETAVLATAPGAISYILALAANGVGDIRAIMVIQNIRLVLVATILPFVLSHSGFAAGRSDVPVSASLLASGAVIAASFIVGLLLQRFRFPAIFLISGMIVSGIGHYLGIIVGRPAPSLLFVGFAITGTMVGARFSSITRADLRSQFASSLLFALIAGVLAAGFALLVSDWLRIPFGQAFMAFAPGGIEAMAAMSIALGFDPAYVATHHLFRTILLIVMVPLLIKLVLKIVGRKNCTVSDKPRD